MEAQVGDLEPSNPDAPQFVPPGHFYSAVPPLSELRPRLNELYHPGKAGLPGIDLREDEQWKLLEQFKHLYQSNPFSETKRPEHRYFFQNGSYSYSDAIFLHCMLRHVQPRRLIEIGSGFSSAATLDTNELFLDDRVAVTFIEPYPDLLRSVLQPGDAERVTLLAKPLQDVPLDVFRTLEADDILFVDSTHVSRAGSDVNYIFFEILPALQPGVCIHFHDIFWPFEYPWAWIEEGRQWHEDYLLRTFLEFNSAFEIVVFNTFLETRNLEWFEQNMPLCLKNLGGSIWLRRVG